MRHYTLLLAFIAVFHSNAHSHETQTHYDRVSLNASSSIKVPQDELQATLYAISEGEEADKTAAEVSQHMQRALSILERQKEIKAQTGSFSTQPVYSKDKITGWRTRQNLQLKSSNAAQLSQLLGRLQNHLSIQNIRYGVSEAERTKAENILIETALKNFQHRARLITHSMHREKYRLIDINISSSHTSPRAIHPVRAAANDAEKIPATPIQAGTEKMEIMINGTIEMQMNAQ